MGTPSPEFRDELQRVLASTILAAISFALAFVLEPPITILAWLLAASGFLSIVYVILALRRLRRMNTFPDPKDQQS